MGMIMIRNLIVSLTAGFMAAASLPAGALAEQPPPPSPELINEIQSRLFDLGYIVWPDGNWDERTRAAVGAWHQLTKRPASDVMSDGDVAYLRNLKPNKVWGGVVYDSKGPMSTGSDPEHLDGRQILHRHFSCRLEGRTRKPHEHVDGARRRY